MIIDTKNSYGFVLKSLFFRKACSHGQGMYPLFVVLQRSCERTSVEQCGMGNHYFRHLLPRHLAHPLPGHLAHPPEALPRLFPSIFFRRCRCKVERECAVFQPKGASCHRSRHRWGRRTWTVKGPGFMPCLHVSCDRLWKNTGGRFRWIRKPLIQSSACPKAERRLALKSWQSCWPREHR